MSDGPEASRLPMLPDAGAGGAGGALRIIVTRPIAQAYGWVDALRKHGFEAHAVPLIDILPAADPGPLQEAWRGLAFTSLVMFVSANAVQHFFVQKPAGLDWPVTALAPSLHSHNTASATCSGCTSRPCGLVFTNSAMACSGVRPVLATTRSMLSRTRSVSVNPGHTALTVMPLVASSSASDFVRPNTPCLAAQ